MTWFWWASRPNLTYRRPQRLTHGELDTLVLALMLAAAAGLVGWWARGKVVPATEESSAPRAEAAPRRVWTPPK